MQKDLLKLYKIIKASDRVKTVRKMMQLEDDEYIITYWNRKGMVIGNLKNEKQRVVESISGEYPFVFLSDKVSPCIKKDIIEYFNLSLESSLVADCILRGRLPTKGFDMWSEIDKKTRKMTMRITLDDVLSPDNLEYLFGKIRQVNFMTKEFFRTKNTKGLSTMDVPYERIKPIQFFDIKYSLNVRYESLRGQYPKRIPQDALGMLIKDAREGMKIEAPYNEEDFRKMISDFKNIFEDSATD